MSQRTLQQQRQNGARQLARQLAQTSDDLSKRASLTSLADSKRECEQQLAQFERDRAAAQAQLDAVRATVATAGAQRREFDDAAAYKQHQATLNRLKADVASKTSALPQAAAAAAKLTKRGGGGGGGALSEAERERTATHDAVTRLEGHIDAVSVSAARAQSELRRDEFADVEKKFGALLVQHTVTELALDDLDRYYRALDQALIRFHATKMAEINKIVKELWQVCGRRPRRARSVLDCRTGHVQGPRH